MLSAAQRLELETRGVVCLRGAVDPRVTSELRARILAFIAERRLAKSAEPGFTIHPSKTGPLLRALPFAELWGEGVIGALDAVLGAGAWTVPKFAGQLLAMSFPFRGAAWQLPHSVWHLDYQAPGSAVRLPGLQPFLCVDRVEPRSGATLVVAGSCRLIDALRLRAGRKFSGRSAEVRGQLLREVPWLRELCSRREGEDRVARFMDRATLHQDVSLQVVELTGDPGDVWLMHPWTLHAPSVNCGERPRMVVTERVRTG